MAQENPKQESKTYYIAEGEVSLLTGRALSTLRNERWRGTGIPYCKVGRSVRYLRQDVIDYMERHRVKIEEA